MDKNKVKKIRVAPLAAAINNGLNSKAKKPRAIERFVLMQNTAPMLAGLAFQRTNKDV